MIGERSSVVSRYGSGTLSNGHATYKASGNGLENRNGVTAAATPRDSAVGQKLEQIRTIIENEFDTEIAYKQQEVQVALFPDIERKLIL